MEAPSVTALLVAGYAVLLLVIAWGFDRMGEHSARRATSWRTGNFVYHEGKDAWQCHEDQWLFPAAFDPDKRVIRYVGTPAVCGQCPVKDECSPTPGPREVPVELPALGPDRDRDTAGRRLGGDPRPGPDPGPLFHALGQ
jgi:hypothetical protein